ncbi:MAG: phosphodiester glycosidase family protein [Sporocytophaga sp.]|uniref:phosphodiester glycosidase family protein n=1 Tax=Sporocytophaga sp. TaxID=2231183 RepID=UPI001B21FB44|nr:phosphodiester glycosidase family protein [Sporocytophaga sp.]MBO9702221.1 phosphodiester glycosidase family protein [Sporocytophaga sp.]
MKFRIFILSTITCIAGTSFHKDNIQWKKLEEGLYYSSVILTDKSIVGDSKVDILKIDPDYFQFKLICAGEKKSESKKANELSKENNLIAVINAGMFKLEDDFKTCTGYMKNFQYVNNPSLNPSYKNIVAFNPKDTSVPKAQIIDMTCQDWNKLKTKYNSFSQGIRMVNCETKNTWQLQEKKWSMVLIGEDRLGNMLFIFVRSPYRVHDFVDHLLAMSIELKRLMYLEGGPEASFYLNHPLLSIEKCGSYETGFNENDNNKEYWNIPNIIGIQRRK